MRDPHETDSPCDGTLFQIRKRRHADGSWVVGVQCLDCGVFKNIPKPYGWQDLPEHDPTIRDKWYNSRREERSKAINHIRANYQEYLQSEEWKNRRGIRLANHPTCEAMIVCGGDRAVQVHHLTYDHLGFEPIWDLRAVCVKCHDALTAMDRNKGKLPEWMA